MEQINDFRLTSTPPVLLITCAVMIALRIGLSIFEWQNPPEKGRSVQWNNADGFVAKAEDKRIKLYEFYAAWCDPCKRLDRDVMTNDEIRNKMETEFVNLRVIDRQKEDGKNNKFVADLEKKYRIFAFPTIVAVGADDEPIGLLVGNSSSLAVYRFLSRVENDAKPKSK